MEKKKTIGKIILDEEFYDGDDRYCDGEIEDELLKIAPTEQKKDFRKITEAGENWPILYHFSPFRENIVEWLPIPPTAKVLEVGSGCGAITGALAKKARSVTCIDLSEKRSMINAHRLQDVENVTIKVGNFMDIEGSLDKDFDYIMLIGVFEYAQGYISKEEPYEEFLKILLSHLRRGGRLCIAIENRLGLKYFAGCREDHAGRYFEGLEGYPGGGVATTFSREKLQDIFHNCGLWEYTFYYPYPDYKFPHTIYSEDILPKKGELHDNIRNFDRDRMILMDEGRVYDTLLDDGLFPLFSNSFFVVTGPAFQAKMVKYSTDRDEKYGICTTIGTDNTGYYVTKRAVYPEAAEHIANLEKAYEDLTKRFEGSDLSFNTCKRVGEKTLRFEYLNGVTLEELLDRAIDKNDREGFLKLTERYKKAIAYHEEVPVCDYDLIFQNILVEDDKWTVIDYEWTYPEAMPSKDLFARAVWCYVQGSKKREIAIKWCELDGDFESVIERERKFQKDVQGDHLALSEVRHSIGNAAFSLDYMLRECGANAGQIKIYEDYGKGFSEENSYQVPYIKQLGKDVTFTVSLPEGLKRLRIDPGDVPVFVVVKKALLDGEDFTDYVARKGIQKKDTNGKKLGNDAFLFAGEDPHFTFRVDTVTTKKQEEKKKLTVTLRVEELSAELLSRL